MFKWLKNILESSESATDQKLPERSACNIPETISKKYEYLVNKYVDIPQREEKFNSKIVIQHKDSKYMISVDIRYGYYSGKFRPFLVLHEVDVVPRNRVINERYVNETTTCQIITNHLEDVIKSLVDINDQIEKSDLMTKKKERQMQKCNERLGRKLQELESL